MKIQYTILLVGLLFSHLTFAKDMGELFQEQGYKALKLEKMISGHDIIHAKVNGIEGLFIMDTGATTVLNTKNLEKFKLSNELNSYKAAGAAGPISITNYSIDSLEIQGVISDVKQVGATDLNAVAIGLYNATGMMIDGIIGMDVMDALSAKIDVSKQLIWIKADAQEHKSLAELSGMENIKVIPLKRVRFDTLDFNFLALEMQANSQAGLLLIDSGSSKTMINEKDLAHFQISADDLQVIDRSAGAGGTFQFKQLPINGLNIAGMDYNITPILTANLSVVIGWIKAKTGVQINGVIGQNFFIKNNAIIDIGSSQLILSD